MTKPMVYFAKTNQVEAHRESQLKFSNKLSPPSPHKLVHPLSHKLSGTVPHDASNVNHKPPLASKMTYSHPQSSPHTNRYQLPHALRSIVAVQISAKSLMSLVFFVCGLLLMFNIIHFA